jgi:hypothetical protein
MNSDQLGKMLITNNSVSKWKVPGITVRKIKREDANHELLRSFHYAPIVAPMRQLYNM